MISRSWTLRLWAAAILVALAASSGHAAAAAAGTERVSTDSSGVEGNGLTFSPPSVAAEGRYVAFASEASNLVPGDTNSQSDIFVHDRQTGSTERVSVSSSEAQADGASDQPSISADGRFVAFESDALNLISGEANGTTDVFIHDRETGSTELVSVNSSGEQSGGPSFDPSISVDGRFVGFISYAAGLVPGDTNQWRDVFIHDRLTGATEQVNASPLLLPLGATPTPPSLSAQGRYVAFESFAPDATGPFARPNIFVYSRHTGVTERVSVSSSGTQGNGSSSRPSISADGRFVAFESDASNLVPDDTNSHSDVFIRDHQTGATARLSVSTAGAQGVGFLGSGDPSISANGRFVSFYAVPPNLVVGDTNDTGDIFVRDVQTGSTERVSVSSSEAEGNALSGTSSSISGDGRFIAFGSAASNLVLDDTNATWDVFVRDRGLAPPLIDTDGDGVPDYRDACPSVVGSSPTGCPPPSQGFEPPPNSTVLLLQGIHSNGAFFDSAASESDPGWICNAGNSSEPYGDLCDSQGDPVSQIGERLQYGHGEQFGLLYQELTEAGLRVVNLPTRNEDDAGLEQGMLRASSKLDPLDQGKQVAEWVNWLNTERGANPIVIVGHSMGGLLARASVRGLSDNVNLRGIITVGTPHLGADSAQICKLGIPIVVLLNDPACVRLGMAPAMRDFNQRTSAIQPRVLYAFAGDLIPTPDYPHSLPLAVPGPGDLFVPTSSACASGPASVKPDIRDCQTFGGRLHGTGSLLGISVPRGRAITDDPVLLSNVKERALCLLGGACELPDWASAVSSGFFLQATAQQADGEPGALRAGRRNAKSVNPQQSGSSGSTVLGQTAPVAPVDPGAVPVSASTDPGAAVDLILQRGSDGLHANGVLRDDGVAPDDRAGDGSAAGTVTLEAGNWFGALSEGSKEAPAYVSVRDPAVIVSGAPSAESRDSDSDGLINEVVLKVPVTAQHSGAFQTTITL